MIECDNLRHDHAKFYAGMNSRPDAVSFVLRQANCRAELNKASDVVSFVLRQKKLLCGAALRHAAINSAVKTKAHHTILVSDPEVGFAGSGICGLRWAGTANERPNLIV